MQCSNLTHFGALIQAFNNVKNFTSVCKPFYLDDRKLLVDIVCDNGLTWVKVIARNSKSLSEAFMGDTSFGVRSVVDQAQEFIDCAKLYPHMFQTPTVSKLQHLLLHCSVLDVFLGSLFIYEWH